MDSCEQSTIFRAAFTQPEDEIATLQILASGLPDIRGVVKEPTPPFVVHVLGVVYLRVAHCGYVRTNRSYKF